MEVQKVYTLRKVFYDLFDQKRNLLLAVKGPDYKARLLTDTQGKKYLVFFSNLQQAHIEDATDLLGQPAQELLERTTVMAKELDGIIINPWSHRLTMPMQAVRDVVFGYKVYLYAEASWWQGEAWVVDYESLMWENLGEYEESWIEEMLYAQEHPPVNIAWWAQEQESPYKKPPLFMQIILAFFGMYWLQMIFTAGLNTLYNKEMDLPSIYTAVMMSVVLYGIIHYLPKFNEWWYQRQERIAKWKTEQQWEADAPKREAEALALARAELEAEESFKKAAIELQQALALLSGK